MCNNKKIIRFLFGAGAAFFLAVGPAAAGSSTRSLPKSTNVLLITIDTLRYDRIGILSDNLHVKTPNLDALARRSVVFTRAFAHDPLTRPSHANIMTGTMPPYHGVIDNPGFFLENRFLTLAEYLLEKKYETAAFTSAIVLNSQSGFSQGFNLYNDYGNDEEVFMDPKTLERNAGVMTKLALEWIADQKQRWFCWLHLFDPHDPYEPPEPYRTQYANDPYSGEVAYVDAQLGLLFDNLEKRGLLDKTIIVVASDHGEALGEKGERTHGFFAYNNTLHIPLFLYYPGIGPNMVKENVCHADIFPTILSLLGLPIPDHIQGESLLPIVADEKRRNTRIFFESMAPHNGMDAAPLRGYIEGDIKFFDLPTKEVYDINADYGEEKNLAHKFDIPEMVKNINRLKSELKGRGTKQDLEGKNAEILPYLRTLGYIAGTPSRRKEYGVGDDPKALHPLILQLRQAIKEAQMGDLDSAVKKIQTVIHIRPTYVSAYASLAKLFYSHNKIGEAIAVLEEGLERNPDNIILTGHLGIMFFLAKQYKDAVKVLDDCTSRARFNPEYFNYLGLAYMNLRKFELAKKAFNQALGIDSSIVAVYNNLGYLHLMHYLETKDKKELYLSLKNFDKALKFDPARPSLIKGKEQALSYLSQN